MLSFIEQGFRKTELTILNHMQMLIKAISLADIVTSEGLKISQNAFLLLANNGLREQFKWSNAPPKFTKKQLECWQKELQVTFGVLHPIPSEKISNHHVGFSYRPRVTSTINRLPFICRTNTRFIKRQDLIGKYIPRQAEVLFDQEHTPK